MRPLRIFLSHTADLASFPAATSFVDGALAAVTSAGDAPSDMAFFTAREQHPAAYCRQKVAEADVYVGILGFRYGSLVEGSQLSELTGKRATPISYTEFEFRAATDLGKPRLVFILDESTALPQTLAVENTYAAEQAAFRHRAMTSSALTVKKVSSVDQLERGVFLALTEVHRDFEQRAAAMPSVVVHAAPSTAAVERPQVSKQARIRRIRQFAGAVRAQIDYLNRTEDWQDQQWEELRALIRVESPPSRVRSVIAGRNNRSVTSLSRSLLKSSSRAILLEGEPGSGKSVALRHVAYVMARRAERRGSLRTPIPLYLNLKNFKPAGAPDSARVLQFVKQSLNASNDEAIDRFLAEEFDERLESGGWVFLFDSFDEVPGILSATDADEIVTEYANALHAFLHGLHDSRGVVATREYRGPRRIPWPRLRVLPLSDTQKRHLVRKVGLARPDEEIFFSGILTAQPSVVQMLDNPLFLSLLCSYIRDNHCFPGSAHQVFESYIGTRMRGSRGDIEERFAISAEQLRSSADEIAFVMMHSRLLGLQPEIGALRATLAEFRSGPASPSTVDAPDLAGVLEALEYLRIGRTTRARGGSASFSFSHRRFQEYFATSYLLEHPNAVSYDELLRDGRWRESAVTIFQTQEASVVGPILNQATRAMEAAASSFAKVTNLREQTARWRRNSVLGRSVDVEESFDWPEGSIHLLGLVQAGFSADDPVVPSRFRRAASTILRNACLNGERHDQRWAIEVVGADDRASAIELIDSAFKIGSPWLDDAIYAQVPRLRKSVSDTSLYFRRQLTSYTQSGLLRKNVKSISAEVDRFPPGSAERTLFHALLWGPWLDLALPVGLIVILGVRVGEWGALTGLLLGVIFFMANPLASSIPVLSRLTSDSSRLVLTLAGVYLRLLIAFLIGTAVDDSAGKYLGAVTGVVAAYFLVWFPAISPLARSERSWSRSAYRVAPLALLTYWAELFWLGGDPAQQLRKRSFVAVGGLILSPLLIVGLWPLVTVILSWLQWEYWSVILQVAAAISVAFLAIIIAREALGRMQDFRLRSQILRNCDGEPVESTITELSRIKSEARQISLLRVLRGRGFFDNDQAIAALRRAARSMSSQRLIDEVGIIVADYLKSTR